MLASVHFGDRLAGAVAARDSQIVLGIDPEPARLWPGSWESTAIAPPDSFDDGRPDAAPRARAAAAVVAHCRALIDATAPACVAAKPQLACFERLGAPGWWALERVVAAAQAAGLLVIVDGKRGDVPVTARAYAQALVGLTPLPDAAARPAPDAAASGPAPAAETASGSAFAAPAAAGLGADAFTANPLLGADALEPLLDGARAVGAGVFVLVRTSNPGAADLFDLPLAAGGTLAERLAELVAAAGRPGVAGIADVGAVVGATEPGHLDRLRALMPHAPFLLPGVGAQGGVVRALAPAFAPGRAGGLISASRSIASAHEATGDAPAVAARDEAVRLRELARQLAG